MTELGWGRHYVAVEPTHFRVDYVINPFMDPAVQPDGPTAWRQWHEMVETLRGLGARVDVHPAALRRPRHGLRDEPRAGLRGRRPRGRHAARS